MLEIKCPVCGKVLKIVKEESSLEEKKIIKIHCNKCNLDINQEV